MSKIARVKFIRDKEPNIKALTAENKVLDGALYVATDTGTLWMGISSSSLIQIKDNINTNTTYNLTKSGSTITLRGSDGSTFNVTDSNTVYGNATASAAGLMSAADKAKLDGVAANSNHVAVDAELSTTSTNPVQNKVIKSALDGKSNTGHKHVKADITDFPTSMPASDVPAWAKAATKPSYSKAEVGLGNVDNTADSAKSVKYATSAGSVAWSNVSGRPSSMPASDVYSWAKQPHKPSYTASEVGAAPASHSHSYLPLAGGTVSGNIHFSSIGDKAKAAGITWDGAADGASIYYETRSAESGHLVLNMTDDANVTVDIAAAGAVKSYFGYDGTFHGNVAGNASSASSVAWGNVTGRPTIPSVGNGTVTITQNGTNKGSFTLNQSGNATIALTDTNTNTWRPEEVIVSSSQPNASTCKLWIKV